MAESTRLVLRLGTLSGTKTYSFKYAKTEVSSAEVNALMDALIENGSIYEHPPMTKESAKVETTTTTEITLS